MSAAVIYARISKDEAGEGLGVDRKERACREVAQPRGLTVGEVLIATTCPPTEVSADQPSSGSWRCSATKRPPPS